MPQDSSFDVRYTPNPAEVENALDQSLKELSQRYDFRGMPASIELDRKELVFSLVAADPLKLKNLREILERRLAGRGFPPAALTTGREEPSLGGTVKQTVKLQKGIPEDKVKLVTAAVKETGLKVRTQIQGNEVRVFGKSKDDLQAVMAALKQAQFGCALDFGNYR
jgi:cyclic-di-GMP-binding protein